MGEGRREFDQCLRQKARPPEPDLDHGKAQGRERMHHTQQAGESGMFFFWGGGGLRERDGRSKQSEARGWVKKSEQGHEARRRPGARETQQWKGGRKKVRKT